VLKSLQGRALLSEAPVRKKKEKRKRKKNAARRIMGEVDAVIIVDSVPFDKCP